MSELNLKTFNNSDYVDTIVPYSELDKQYNKDFLKYFYFKTRAFDSYIENKGGSRQKEHCNTIEECLDSCNNDSGTYREKCFRDKLIFKKPAIQDVIDNNKENIRKEIRFLLGEEKKSINTFVNGEYFNKFEHYFKNVNHFRNIENNSKIKNYDLITKVGVTQVGGRMFSNTIFKNYFESDLSDEYFKDQTTQTTNIAVGAVLLTLFGLLIVFKCFDKPDQIGKVWVFFFIVFGVVGSIFTHRAVEHSRGDTFDEDDAFRSNFNEILKYHNLLVYYKKDISKDIFEEVLNENNTSTSNTTISNTV